MNLPKLFAFDAQSFVKIFIEAFALIGAEIDVAKLAAVVIDSQTHGMSFSAAVAAVQADLSAIVLDAKLIPVATFLLGLLHKTNAAPTG